MPLQSLLLKRCSARLNLVHCRNFANGQLNTEENGLPPKKSRVVICGGGVMGASVAYHLAQMGWGPHTVLLEQGR